MFEKSFEQRLLIWHDFRKELETAEDPIQDAINFFSTAPLTSMAADPYTQDTWPGPWELIEENNFCPFVKILAICYTLQLTDRFTNTIFEIHITQDQKRSSTDYLLYVGDVVIGLVGDTYVHRKDIPITTVSERKYTMPDLQ